MTRQRLFFPFAPRAVLCAAFALLVLACGPAARAQQQPLPDDDERLTVESNLIRLNVGVADNKGRPVLDLSGNDFVIYEDGMKQTILDFAPAQTPFSLVLLLDTSGSTLSFRTSLKQAALRFLDALGPNDRVAVVTFWAEKKEKDGRPQTSERIQTLADFTTDRRKMAFAIERAQGHGETNLYRALRHALNMLAKETSRRKAIVVLTDGKDTELQNLDRRMAANAQSDAEALAAVKDAPAPQVEAVLNAADRQGVTIYPLALPSGDLRRLAQPSPQQTAIYTFARARLQTLADRTGGRLHEINRLEDMGRLYAEVAAEMRTLYTISYQSSGGRARDGKWRAIQIEVTRPALIARTRPGYFAR